MALIHKRDNPQAFVILREALKKDYDYLVKEVDQLCIQAGKITNYCTFWKCALLYVHPVIITGATRVVDDPLFLCPLLHQPLWSCLL